MGIARFTGVEKIQGGSMPFESYLKQINLLYPNVPDMYLKYLTMINEFDSEQMARLIEEEQELAVSLFDSKLVVFQELKDRNYELFASLLETYEIKETLQEIFEIGGMSLEEMLEHITSLYDVDSTPEELEEYAACMLLVYGFHYSESERLLNVLDDDLADTLNDLNFSHQTDLLKFYLINVMYSGREQGLTIDNGVDPPFTIQISALAKSMSDIYRTLEDFYMEHIITEYDDTFKTDENLSLPVIGFQSTVAMMKKLFDFNPDLIELFLGQAYEYHKEVVTEIFNIESGGSSLFEVPFVIGRNINGEDDQS